MEPYFDAFSVAVVDDDPKLRTRLAMQLGTGVRSASFPSIELLEERFVAGEPLVVVFGPTFSTPAGLSQVERFTRNGRRSAPSSWSRSSRRTPSSRRCAPA